MFISADDRLTPATKPYRDSYIFMDGFRRSLPGKPDVVRTGCLSNTIEDDRPDNVEVRSEPVVFDGCFGWYHPGSAQLGVVLCGPQGYEELCVHRHWRALAQELSQQGLPTLRFDYPGTGDSADEDETPDRVQAWVESICGAVRALRRIATVERVALVGLRMGAMLAIAAAERMGDLAALVLLAPIGSGETCVRELRALAWMRAAARHQNAASVTAAGGLEAAGFIYTPQTIADLRGLRLLQSGRAPAERILLLNRPNAAVDRNFHARLAGCGAPVEEDVFHDYPLLIRNVDLSVYPRDGFDRVVRWLAELRGNRQERRAAITRVTVLRLPDAAEKPVFFNRNPDLFGVLCEPRGPACRTALVFLNTGSNHHIGTSRMTVTMARRMARLGFASLRFDISGIGDSDAPIGRSADHPQESSVDVSTALDGLRDKGYDDFILIGLCSGARLALETTIQDDRVVGQILLNLQGYWKPTNADAQHVSRRAYFRMVRSLSTWQRAARGEVDLWGIARTMARRTAEAAAHNMRAIWGKIRRRDSVRSTGMAQFRSLAARNVKTCFVYVEENSGLYELEVVFGRSGQILCNVPNISVKILSEGDHIFSWGYSRRQLLSVVEESLAGMVAAGAVHPAASNEADSMLAIED